MTVTYTAEVATVRGFGCFLKLLKRWKGSIYKLVYMDLFIFLVMYYCLNFTYRFALGVEGKEYFANIVKYCKEYSDLIPLSFVLGFYVSIVMTRWWNQYTAIPFPDPLAVFVSATIHGNDERGRKMRRTIMRYVCLCVTMVFTMISPRVKKRFPTLDHLEKAGMLQESERIIMNNLDSKFPKYSKHWLPIVWAASIITRARKEGRIRDDFAVKTIIDELNKFRGQCGLLLSYDTISIPLVYTQVVTLAVYTYFLTTLMGHQWTEGQEYKFDLYFPVFTTLQFFFYVGWLKVAETLINPFGDDDDDFEVNWMIDRNLQMSYLIVDEMHHEHPELVRDQYWDEVFPAELPYTAATAAFKDNHPQPSTAHIAVTQSESENVPVFGSLKIDEPYMNDMQSGPIMFSAKPMKTRGSQNSMANTATDTGLKRKDSAASMLKRFFSREDSRNESKVDGGELELLNPSTVATKPSAIGSTKLIRDIIEEVDEQNTITSQRSRDESRPTVIGLFGPPPPSQPINVPVSLTNHHTYRSDTSAYEPYILSKSAPETTSITAGDRVSIGGSVTDESDDEFTKLKKKRDEERLSRLKLNLTRSISGTGSDANESLLLSRRQSLKTPTTSQPITPQPILTASEFDVQ